MALEQSHSGSASVSTTEFSFVNGTTTIPSTTTAGVYQLYVDVSAMVAGDSYEFYLREKARSGDTQRQQSLGIIAGAQAWPLFVSGAFHLMHGWDFTAKRLAGTDRTLTWSIRRAF